MLAEKSIRQSLTSEADLNSDGVPADATHKWTDEAAAMRAVQQMSTEEWRRGSPPDGLFSSPDIDEEEVSRLVGKKSAKAIEHILGRDRNGKQKTRETDKRALQGVPFWDNENYGDNGTQLNASNIEVRPGCEITRALKNAVVRGGVFSFW